MMLKYSIGLFFLFSINACAVDSSNLNDWALFVIEPNKKTIGIYLPGSNTYSSKSAKQMPKNYYAKKDDIPRFYKCHGVNYTSKLISCTDRAYDSNIINFTTLRYHTKKLKISGVFNIDGKYIIDKNGYGIYDIKSKKTINVFNRYYEGRVLLDQFGSSFFNPTSPDADGDFYALTISERGHTSTPNIYSKFNLYDIINKKGKGFKVNVDKTKRKIYSWMHYVGNQHYLNSKKAKPPTSLAKIKIEKWNPNGEGSCHTTHDGNWAICYYHHDKGNFIIYDVTKKVIVRKVTSTLHLSGNIIWVWIGDPKKYTGYKY